MLIFDEHQLAIETSCRQALLAIPGVDELEVISLLGHDTDPTYIVDVKGRDYSGFRLVKILPVEEKDDFLAKLPHPSQMKSLLGSIPIVQSHADAVTNDKIALLYELPGFTSQASRRLVDLLTIGLMPHGKVSAHLKSLATTLLRWNSIEDILKHSKYSTPINGLGRCFLQSHLLPERVHDLSDSIPIIALEGWRTLPNPLAYAKHAHLWDSSQSISIPLGRVNGRLLASNVLVRTDVVGSSPIILDWSAAKYADVCPFVDYATLELDLLFHIMPALEADLRSEWLPLIEFLTSDVTPPPPDVGIHSLVAWRVIEPLREAVQSVITAGLQVQRDFTSAFWLSAVAAGLRLIYQPYSSLTQRLVGLLYAAHALDRLPVTNRPGGRPAYLSLHSLQQAMWSGRTYPFESGCALLVGVGEYSLPLSTIPAAAQDALSLEQKLAELKYPRDHVLCVTNGNATRDEIWKHLHRLRDISDSIQNPTIVIYYSGHGVLLDGEYYLLPYGVALSDVTEEAISIRSLSEWMTKLNGERRVVFIDACHSGGEVPMLASSLPERQLEQLVGGGNVVITSSDVDQKSYILPGQRNSLFTTCLLEALSSGNYNGRGKAITLFDVFNYVAEQVRQRAARAGWKQTPKFGANINRSFSLGLLEESDT